MWTQRQSIPSDRAARLRRSRCRLTSCAAIISATFGLMVGAQTASSQTLDRSVGVVQPNAVRAAERHRVHAGGGDALVDAAVALPAPQTVRQDSHVYAAPKVDSNTRSTRMNRTAQALLESDRQATGLPSTAMICVNCEPEPPYCRRYGCNNSPIVDGATIAVGR